MLRRNYTVILAVVLLTQFFLFSQTYQGPQEGSVSSGAIVNTGLMRDYPISDDSDPIIRGEFNLTGINNEPLIIESDGRPVLPTTYTEDKNIGDNPEDIGDNALLLQKFRVNVDNNVIPPDPTMAVGPNHVMVLTNNGTGIRIYDKQGNLLKSIGSNAWWSAVWPSQSGDPQIFYDHFAGRWVMVFMQVDDAALTAGNLLAYSDDEDPLGTWYMYRLDTKIHGTTASNTWGDYPQIGFDEQAIYIMTRCFTFGGGFNYTKIRIISKEELYASNAGRLTYKDIWDITVPGQSTRPDVIHPSFHFSASGEHYLLFANRGGGNFYTLYKISNPVTSPVLTGTNIIVPFFGSTPNANQLGGSTTLIETNGSHIKTSPVFKDGYLYATHSIRNSTNLSYASVKYVKIDVSNNTVVEDAELGATGYYYFYPAIAVDKNDNIGITCSRSGETEYIGSYFITRRASDPPGLSSARLIQAGLGNYVVTFGGTRNRWGDYLASYIDPTDSLSFWFYSQFASGTNAYSTVVAQVRLEPFEGVYSFIDNSSLNFGDVEVGTESSNLSITLSNYGNEDFIISSIPDSVGDFHRVTNLTFPLTVQTFDSLIIEFKYKPTIEGIVDTLFEIVSNSTTLYGIHLSGYGFVINPAPENKLYAISGSQNSGNFVLLNTQSGLGTNIGPTNYNDFVGLAIHPVTHMTYALRAPSSTVAEIYRVNGALGNSYKLFSLPLLNLFSIAFDKDGILYAIQRNGELYTVNLDSGTYSFVSTVPVERVTMAFDPLTNDLWGSVKSTTNPRDLIIKINTITGDTTIVGNTGFGVNTTEIAFDEYGVLYGVKGIGAVANSDLFTINKNTGAGTLIGSVGLKDIRGIAYSLGEPSSVEDNNNTPVAFSLTQNYPNPFNPSTQIKFDLPVNASVKVVVYNLLGETVKEIFTGELNAGTHRLNWNADDKSGNKVSSGIYFYEIRANGQNGESFNDVKKMMLLK